MSAVNIIPDEDTRVVEFKKRLSESRPQTAERPPKRVVKTEPSLNDESAEPTDRSVTNGHRHNVRKFLLRLSCAIKKVSVPDRVDDPNFFTRVVDFIGEFTEEQSECFHQAMAYEKTLLFDKYNDDKETYFERYETLMKSNLHAAEQQHKKIEDILKGYDDPLPLQCTGDSVVAKDERRAVQRWIQNVSVKARRLICPGARVLDMPLVAAQDSAGTEYMITVLSEDRTAYCENLNKLKSKEKKMLTDWLTSNAEKIKVLRDHVDDQ